MPSFLVPQPDGTSLEYAVNEFSGEIVITRIRFESPRKNHGFVKKCTNGPNDGFKCTNGPNDGLKCTNGPNDEIKCKNGPNDGLKCTNRPNDGLKCTNGPNDEFKCKNGPDAGLKRKNSPGDGLECTNTSGDGLKCTNGPDDELKGTNTSGYGLKCTNGSNDGLKCKNTPGDKLKGTNGPGDGLKSMNVSNHGFKCMNGPDDGFKRKNTSDDGFLATNRSDDGFKSMNVSNHGFRCMNASDDRLKNIDAFGLKSTNASDDGFKCTNAFNDGLKCPNGLKHTKVAISANILDGSLNDLKGSSNRNGSSNVNVENGLKISFRTDTDGLFKATTGGGYAEESPNPSHSSRKKRIRVTLETNDPLPIDSSASRSDLAIVSFKRFKRLDDQNENENPYWPKRKFLFSRFDSGIRMDDESWYSVTPEIIAKHIADKVRCDVIVDACAGAAGNAIQFAFTCHYVVALDIDAERILKAKHNAKVYDVEQRIEFIQADALSFLEKLEPKSVDVVFLSPPWGGPGYQNSETFEIDCDVKMIDPNTKKLYDGVDLFRAAFAASKYGVAYFLPRNLNRTRFVELVKWVVVAATASGVCGSSEDQDPQPVKLPLIQFDMHCLGNRDHTVCAYVGDFMCVRR